MKKLIGFAVALILIFSCATLAEPPADHGGQGHGGHDMPGPGDGPGIMGADGVFKFIDELKLTDDQLKKLHDLKDGSKRDLFKLKNDMMMLVWDIQDELKKDVADKNKLYAMADKMAENERKIAKMRIDQMLKVKEILTPEQFRKLTDLIEAKKSKMKHKLVDKVLGGK